MKTWTFTAAEPPLDLPQGRVGVTIIETLAQDVRYAARVLLKARGYSVAAILTLALGIGATTAIFTLVNGLLLRPLPVREPGRLVGVRADGPGPPWIHPQVWEQIRDRPQLFERACAASPLGRFNVADRGVADWVDGFAVSGSFFETLGVRAIVGRTLTAADDQRGGGPDGPVAVISHAFWQRRFGGAVGAIGRSLTLNRVAYTIVGVTAPEFFGPEVGRSFDIAASFAGSYGSAVSILARLRPDQTPASATAALRAAQPQIREAALAAIAAKGAPASAVADLAKTFLRVPLSATPAAVGASDQQGRFERPLLAMLMLAGLVLLIACANVANLVLGRAMARRHEMSVRRALGASRLRLARQVLVESLLLSAVGAALGLCFAQIFGRALVRQAWTEVNPLFLDLSLDWRVLAFTAAATVGTALLFGLTPAFRAARVQPNDALKEGGRGHAGERRWGLNQILVVGQVAFSVVVIVAAGLFVRTFATLATMDLGFDRQRTVIVSLNTQDARVPPANRPAFYERIRQAVALVPGTEGAVTLQSVPASQDHWIADVRVVGQTRPSVDPKLGPFLNAVSPGYFSTFGAPILAGRGFDQRDGRGTPLAAIVNETFARLALSGRNPIGEALTFMAGHEREAGAGPPSSSPPFQIVGLAKDSGSAVNYALRQGIPPTVYFCIAQMDPAIANFTPPPAFRIGVRVASASATREVVAAVTRVEPQLRMIVRPMAGYIDRNLVTERLAAVLSALFGSLALVLAGVGIFGVTAYAVTRRRAEIGIRIALGASPASVVRLVLQRIVILVVAGICIGGVVSVWTSRFVAAMLFGLQPRDPATFAVAAIVLVTVAVLAGWLPARRAARIDPAIVLRNE
jgi:predicted permease